MTPKFALKDIVRFQHLQQLKTGIILVVDRCGTAEQNVEPSYDILVEEEQILYKHVRESWVLSDKPISQQDGEVDCTKIKDLKYPY